MIYKHNKFIKFQKIIFVKLRPEEAEALKSMTKGLGLSVWKSHGKALKKGCCIVLFPTLTLSPSFSNFIRHYVKAELWRNKNENGEMAWRPLHE